MKSKNFKGKRGTTSKLLSEFISSNLKTKKSTGKKTEKAVENKKEDAVRSGRLQEEKGLLKRPTKLGKLYSPDIRDISVGYSGVRDLISNGLDIFSTNLLQGKNKEVNKLQEGIVLYKDTINLFLNRADRVLVDKSRLKEFVEDLRSSYRAAQAARDGVLMKQETRTEIDENGEKKQVKFDVSMTEEEVINALDEYRHILERYRYNQLNNYVDMGVNIVGIIGMIRQSLQDNNKGDKESFSAVSLGIMAVSLIKLICKDIPNSALRKKQEMGTMKNRKSHEFLSKEQISYYAEEDTVAELQGYAKKEKSYSDKEYNIRLGIDTAMSLITAIVSGIYVTNQVKSKGKKSLDSKTLADALVSLGTTKGYAANVLQTVIHMKNDTELKENLEFYAKKVEEIEKQMQEKVYPLIGATESFDSFSIENLDGKFYPTTDYETGEVHYGTEIKVPEFSIRRGQTVLLTGDSGAGKSTFLRLLKRGDINNRGCIKLDNGEVVDNLGKEYISFKPSTELGSEGTVLNQITGKNSISELDQGKKESLVKILKELNLYNDRILEDMASKRFTQFSTGQQRRLALSKMLYRIKDGTSVVIVDEPVGNVEDSLIKEQLEIIKKYAMDNDMMLILVTHRIDLAEKIADKRYHISKDGIMQEVKIKRQDKEFFE